jgi:hypothetical protein
MKKLPNVTNQLFIKMFYNTELNPYGDLIWRRMGSIVHWNTFNMIDVHIISLMDYPSNKQLENSFKLLP